MRTWLFTLAGSVAFWIVLKATLLLAVTALVAAACRKASAAARHVIWSTGVASVLLLPLASLAAPAWTIAIRVPNPSDAVVRAEALAPAREIPLAPAASVGPKDALPDMSPRTNDDTWADAGAMAWAAYAAGLLLVLLHLAAQHARVRRLSRAAAPVTDPEWAQLLNDVVRRAGATGGVRLLRSRELTVPIACGVRRPAIVLPAIADTWSDERRRAVLLHEVAHVCRRDCLTQALAWVACAVYWFHPLAWWAARRLCVERELACDDRVIAAGTEAREYAGHLLDIAYSLGRYRAPALAVGMARPGQLEGRMRAALDGTRSRRRPTRRFHVAAVALTALLIGPVSGAAPMFVEHGNDAEPAAQSATASTAAAGAVLPETLKAVEWPLARKVERLIAETAASIGAPDDAPGTWQLESTDTAGTVHLRLNERQNSTGSNVALAQLEGLSAAQLSGPGGQVQFRLRRDAGAFTFEGVMRSGVGAGTFSFAPNPDFPAELARRGFARPTADEQYQLARHDVGYAFVDELKAQGYAVPQTADLVRAGQHGVSTSYLKEMGALGYRLGSLDPLITLRDHGVTPDYVRQLAELGYKGLSADTVRAARDHGVTPEYIRGMRDAGASGLPLDQLVQTRNHGVTPEYIQALAAAGHRGLSVAQLVRVRDHGVTADYVRDMKALGFALSIDELVGARDHGVTADYARDMKALGLGDGPIASLMRLRDHGVTPEYAKGVVALGYERLTADQFVTLRDHGVTPERIREANSRNGSRLSVDELTSRASRGMR